ncbi:MAG: hypothetical protein AVO39_04565 [delta proteobacterium MLS_D]|jgi:2-keto-4-pentenoate hydratase/2-oxohepta-3-ene-1,7-dioic acid hydratase in catechol pathway|nr:MAG: hypothetical protein AVO39_04565 [delta proteobacterium MLS_D]
MRIIRFRDEQGGMFWGIPEDEGMERARIIEGDLFSGNPGERIAHVSRLAAPVAPANIYAVGFNYRRHADETATVYPDEPEIFMKPTTSVAGPGDAILLPLAGPDEVDYEGELAVIIGRTGKNLSPAEAREHVLGYCCANDVSARDWQWRRQQRQWVRGKSFDTFCPLGPWIETGGTDFDPTSLRIQTFVNDRKVQDGVTGDMIFGVYDLISSLSQSVTLLPGTVILTGTPEGVGYTRQPPIFLRAGDRVSVRIEGLGTLTNPVASEGDVRGVHEE